MKPRRQLDDTEAWLLFGAHRDRRSFDRLSLPGRAEVHGVQTERWPGRRSSQGHGGGLEGQVRRRHACERADDNFDR